jgi:hypothetical protein
MRGEPRGPLGNQLVDYVGRTGELVTGKEPGTDQFDEGRRHHREILAPSVPRC